MFAFFSQIIISYGTSGDLHWQRYIFSIMAFKHGKSELQKKTFLTAQICDGFCEESK